MASRINVEGGGMCQTKIQYGFSDFTPVGSLLPRDVETSRETSWLG